MGKLCTRGNGERFGIARDVGLQLDNHVEPEPELYRENAVRFHEKLG